MPGVIVFDPEDQNAGFSVGNDQAAGVYTDIENDAMYLSDLSNIYLWNGDTTTNQIAVWKSGKLRLDRAINLGAVLIDAESYDSVSFKLWAELEGSMSLITTVTIADNDPVRLPGGYTSSVYEIQITTTDRVYSIAIGESVFDLAEA